MDWPSVILTGLSSGLAVAVAELVSKRTGKRGALYYLVLFLAMSGLNGFAHSVIGPEIRASQAIRAARSFPIVAALRTIEPAVSEQVEQLAVEAARTGDKTGEVRAKIRSTVATTAFKHAGKASDAAAIDIVAIAAQNGEILAATDPQACFNYFYPQPGKFYDLSKRLPKDAVEKELNAMTLLLTTAAANSNRVPTEAEVAKPLEVLAKRLSEKYSASDLELLESAAKHPEKAASMCTMTLAMFKEILKLPKENQGPLFRFMFATVASRFVWKFGAALPVLLLADTCRDGQQSWICHSG